METTDCSWKPNWVETKHHLEAWWSGEGLVLGGWYGVHRQRPHESVEWGEETLSSASLEQRYIDPVYRARLNHHRLAHTSFVADTLPIAETDIGPGALALLLGAKPRFAEDTVWLAPCIDDLSHFEDIPPLRFDPQNRWWLTMETILRTVAEYGRGRYLTACPDLSANLDVLASLRGTPNMLLDLADRPDWVLEKVDEINQAWHGAYRRVYPIVRLEDGGSATDDFRLWGPGKTAMLQCDAAAMISPAMFEQFVLPALREQSAWLDHAMYHVDGPDGLRHLEMILDIDSIQAIEWTPGPGVPTGGTREWYSLYRRVLDAGKSVQVVDIRPEEAVPLLDAVGGAGVYMVLTGFRNEAESERLLKDVEPYGRGK